MKILVLSKDSLFCDKLIEGMSYLVEMVADEDAANNYLERQHDVIGLVIDSGLAQEPPEAWLTSLRTKLAWTGLPTLFVIRDEHATLKALLNQFDAPNVEMDLQQPQKIQAALSQILKGEG
jgi:hypothetical protein